eukprot:4400626-Alexandrium_andersonii.AAC.1
MIVVDSSQGPPERIKDLGIAVADIASDPTATPAQHKVNIRDARVVNKKPSRKRAQHTRAPTAPPPTGGRLQDLALRGQG